MGRNSRAKRLYYIISQTENLVKQKRQEMSVIFVGKVRHFLLFFMLAHNIYVKAAFFAPYLDICVCVLYNERNGYERG